MQVYADNAATTRMHQTAIDTMTYHLNNTFGNPSSLYTIGQQAKEVLEYAIQPAVDEGIASAPSRARSISPPAAARPTIRPLPPPPISARARAKSTSFPPRLSITPSCIP